MGLDPLYYILSIPALILSAIFSARVKSVFSKYAKVRAESGMSGAEAAATMLAKAGVSNVEIKTTSGFLSDHYNPLDKTLNLSPDVYNGRSLASLGVACHEAGHALQHASGYRWLGLRSALVPVANLGSRFAYIVFFAGLMLSAGAAGQGGTAAAGTAAGGAAAGGGLGMMLVKAGIVLFCGAVAFSLVTLPVEWNASARAKRELVKHGLLSPTEEKGAAAVLNTAFMTYVAAAVSSISTLFYFLIRSGLLNGGRRR
ncbi:MAG: zinc metallopeptidase [Kiritimatiellae bacterium]|nr:zinc metallopeptidase [Kiritimatiellia bacterium]